MKKFLSIALLLMVSAVLHAQQDVTRFLGIPVDGSKEEMIRKLRAKGFVLDPKTGVLEGEFNGTDVNVHIATNNNKVCRIMVCDVTSVDERSIQIRFNKLCKQFENNPKYMRSLGADDFTIPYDEDLSYEITVNNKRYEAAYYQQPADSIAFLKDVISVLLSKYKKEQMTDPDAKIKMKFISSVLTLATDTVPPHDDLLSEYTEEQVEDLKSEILKDSVMATLEVMSKKSVWFMISDFMGKYYISMFYDNEYNRANGEDL